MKQKFFISGIMIMFSKQFGIKFLTSKGEYGVCIVHGDGQRYIGVWSGYSYKCHYPFKRKERHGKL